MISMSRHASYAIGQRRHYERCRAFRHADSLPFSLRHAMPLAFITPPRRFSAAPADDLLMLMLMLTLIADFAADAATAAIRFRCHIILRHY